LHCPRRPAFAKEATVKGQIVDVSCYNMDKANNAGPDHKMPKGDTKEAFFLVDLY
jgi:hypothetical protein